MSSERLFDFLISIATQLPSILAMLVCLIFAVTRWKRHPKVSLLIIISLLLLLIHGVSFAAVYNWLPEILAQSYEYQPGRMEKILRLVGFMYNTLLAVPIALLLVAVFVDRKPKMLAT